MWEDEQEEHDNDKLRRLWAPCMIATLRKMTHQDAAVPNSCIQTHGIGAYRAGQPSMEHMHLHDIVLGGVLPRCCSYLC